MLEPAGTSTAELVIRRSRFIGYGIPAATPDEVTVALRAVKEKHPDASHVVHAALVGAPHSEIGSMTDAGEPKGTAGRPIMDILRGSGIRNLVIAVVRYFGGTKLGTGGLVHAYGDTARAVLSELPTRPLVIRVARTIVTTYAQHDPVRRLIVESGSEIHAERFNTDVEFEVSIPVDRVEALLAAITNATAGTARVYAPNA